MQSQQGRTGRNHTHKESLHPAEGCSELSEHVGQAGWEVGAVVLGQGTLVAAGSYPGQQDQATQQRWAGHGEALSSESRSCGLVLQEQAPGV